MNNQPMQFAPMAPMAKNNNNQMMMQLLQTALARGSKPGGAPTGPEQGATLPGGAMNLMPQQPQQMGLLARLFRGGMGAQPGAPMAEHVPPMDSTNALY